MRQGIIVSSSRPGSEGNHWRGQNYARTSASAFLNHAIGTLKLTVQDTYMSWISTKTPCFRSMTAEPMDKDQGGPRVATALRDLLQPAVVDRVGRSNGSRREIAAKKRGHAGGGSPRA
jgi:hypothetical protein